MAEQVIIKDPVIIDSEDTSQLQNVSSGEHLEEFISFQKTASSLDSVGCINLRNSACDIISYCNPHNAVDNIPTTHLVVGYVQSGKTMSFTSVIELALDCHYKFVVVFAGITNNLLEQTYDRLSTDLICNNSINHRNFKLFKNPTIDNAKEIARSCKLHDSIVVITVLKHSSHIDNVAELFQSNELSSLANKETVLIIDDEADQASLNNFGRVNTNASEEDIQMSSTYESIVSFRNVLPANSYIQYTATPQANILINTLDILSPRTHTLLKPGKGYCGGKLFFGVGDEGKRFGRGLVITIPENEVFHSKRNPLDSMPRSLNSALMVHLCSVAILERLNKTSGISQLSMMVHTDVTLNWNRIFYDWINDALSNWSDILEESGMSVTKYRLIEAFKEAYKEASKFYDNLSFEEVLQVISDVINDTHVYLITGETDDIENLNWNQHSSNILVGAQMLNRGFTVKNLTTTYMPRYSISATNADTIEQRCRFFGYKEKYIKSCRVYLPQDSIDNYISYIKSEEELRKVMSETKSLEKCGHKILTYPSLRPTRTNVLPKSIITTQLKGMKEYSPYRSSLTYNLYLTDKFIADHSDIMHPFVKNGYVYADYHGMRNHSAFETSIEEAIKFLKMYQFGNVSDMRYKADTIRYLYYLQETKLIDSIVFINMSDGTYKERTLDSITYKLKGSNVFNGPSSSTENGPSYLGDRAMYSEDTITIQLHHIKFLQPQGLKASSIAIHCPEQLAVRYTSLN